MFITMDSRISAGSDAKHGTTEQHKQSGDLLQHTAYAQPEACPLTSSRPFKTQVLPSRIDAVCRTGARTHGEEQQNAANLSPSHCP